MKEFLIVIASFLVVGLTNSYSIPSNEYTGGYLPISNASEGKLIFAHVIYRHGARNIQKYYPNDPFRDEKHWPEGLGQLTRDGKVQGGKLGKYFRRRYNRILSDRYSANDVYVQSTDVDRAIMTAQTNLAALYRPTDEEVWDDDLDWQPVPVHTIPAEFDYTLYCQRKCPKYRRAFRKYVKRSDEVQKILYDNKDLLDYWSDKCGLKLRKINHVHKLYKTLSIERAQKKDIPKWAKEAIAPGGKMEKIALYYYGMATATKKLARLKSGFLLKEMLEHFSDKINQKLKPDRSLWLYSSHETALANILNSLGLFKLHFPPFVASVHFELYKAHAKEYYIQIFYRTEGEEYPSALEIPRCGKKCDFDKFYDLYRDIIPDDFERECGLDERKKEFEEDDVEDDEDDEMDESDENDY